MSEIVDHLEEDFIQIPSQRYALISVVSPNSTQKLDTCALKIRGVFATQEEANRHAEKLTKTDRTFDVFLVEMYKWLPIPPNVDLIDDKVYQEQMLNDIIQGHKEQQILVKQHFEERKMDSIQAGSSSKYNSSIDDNPVDETSDTKGKQKIID